MNKWTKSAMLSVLAVVSALTIASCSSTNKPVKTNTATISDGVKRTTTTDDAKSSSYTITKTSAMTKTPYYLTDEKKTTYAWNKNHTKKLQIIKPDASNYSWYADQQITLKHNGKYAVYYRVVTDSQQVGYVWHGYLTKGYGKNVSTTINDGDYYRLNAATKVTLGKKAFILPKGTLVRASTDVANQKEYLTVTLNNLSYTLKKRVGITYNDMTASAGLASSVKWTKVSEPSYMLPNTNVENTPVWYSDLFPGTKETAANTKRMRITTDGYLEFYNNGSHQSTSTSYPIGAPTSRKILKSSTHGNTVTVTYDQAVPGLKDTAVTVNGKTEYQLTIEKKARLTDMTSYALANYSVGGKAFYSWASALLLPNYDAPKTPTTLGEIAFNKLDKEFFNTDSFYKTTKAVKIQVPFTGYNGGASLTKSVTLPKGTVVAGNDVSRTKVNGKYIKVISIHSNLLSANLLKSGYAAGLVASSNWQTQFTPGKNFKEIKRPSYLPSYSYGDLYLGSTAAIKYRAIKLSKQSIVITTNGYIEIHKNSARANSASYFSKPIVSAKIERTVVKNHTRQLFLNKKLSGFKTTKVQYQGKTQYCLDLTNQHEYRVVQPLEDGDDGPAYYMLYIVGGKTFYTPLGSING
ncbi:MAG: hypothetical protein ABF683_09715 [Sporolactobacillus sp.]